jgi:hypothetical protein
MKNSVQEFKILSDKAEGNARKRENKVSNEFQEKLKDLNMSVTEFEIFASNMGLGVYKKRGRSNIKHVQIIQENLNWCFENNLLDDKEQKFLFRILPFVEFGTNCICRKVNGKYESCNITELATMINREAKNISPIIKSLIKKGFMGYFITGIDGKHPKNENEVHPGKCKILFVNPRIMHSGYNDKVNEALQRMFKKSLTDLPIKMF